MGEASPRRAIRQRRGQGVPTSVTLRLDVPARLALAALIADGTPIDEAVREAIIAAGARWLEQPQPLGEDPPKRTGGRERRRDTADMTRESGPGPRRKAARLTPDETAALEEWASREVADAPPPSACQIYVLREAFIEGRIVEACDARDDPGRQTTHGAATARMPGPGVLRG